MTQARAWPYCRIERPDADVQAYSIRKAWKADASAALSKKLQISFVPRLTSADDGFSGTSFRRPGFQEMLADIEAGLVNMAIVKDECDKIELKSESPQKCGFCDVSSVF